MAQLNEALKQFSMRELHRIHSTHKNAVIDRFMEEQAAFRNLPDRLPRPVITEVQKVNKFSEITVDTNKYSIPSRYAFRSVTIEVSDSEVRVYHAGEEIARHERCSGKNESAIDPMHYIDTLLKKHRSLPRAAAFAKGRLPDPLLRLLNKLVIDDELLATKRWSKTLALAKKYSLDTLSQAAEIAMARRLTDHESIGLILRQRNDHYPVLVFDSADSTARKAQRISLDQYQISELVECAA
jgi:hypothetical protein